MDIPKSWGPVWKQLRGQPAGDQQLPLPLGRTRTVLGSDDTGGKQVRRDPGQAHSVLRKQCVSALGQGPDATYSGMPSPRQACVSAAPHTDTALLQLCCPRLPCPVLSVYPTMLRGPCQPAVSHAGPHWRPPQPRLVGPVVDLLGTGCVLLCTLPFAAFYLSLMPSSFPQTLLSHSALLAPGACGRQSWLRQLSSQDTVCCRR